VLTELGAIVATVLLGALVTLVGWLLGRAVRGVDEKLDGIAERLDLFDRRLTDVEKAQAVNVALRERVDRR